MKDILFFRPDKVGGEGYVERQVDDGGFGRRRWNDTRRTLRTSQWLLRWHILVKTRHAKSCWSHPFPAMASLASEVADFVHIRMSPQVIDVEQRGN